MFPLGEKDSATSAPTYWQNDCNNNNTAAPRVPQSTQSMGATLSPTLCAISMLAQRAWRATGGRSPGAPLGSHSLKADTGMAMPPLPVNATCQLPDFSTNAKMAMMSAAAGARAHTPPSARWPAEPQARSSLNDLAMLINTAAVQRPVRQCGAPCLQHTAPLIGSVCEHPLPCAAQQWPALRSNRHVHAYVLTPHLCSPAFATAYHCCV